MARVRQAQTNFALGELSPRMAARSDVSLYRNGAARLQNRRPLSTGGTSTRHGSRFIATLPANSRGFEFIFNADQRYVVVLSPGRFDAWLADGTPCTAITGAPWTLAMMDDLGFAQDGDTLLIFHRTMAPQRIRRTGATTFALDAMPVESPPFVRLAAIGTTATASAVGAVGTTATITFSAATMSAGRVNEWFMFRGKRSIITGFTSATVITVTWQEDTTGVATAGTTDWQEQAWSATAGWPGVGAFLDGRLWLAASTAQPTGVWGSRPNAFFNFNAGTGQDGDAISEVLRGWTRILHIVPAERLLLFTARSVHFVPGSEGQPITPARMAFRLVSQSGTLARPRPVRFDGAVLYIDQTGRTARELVWSDTAQTYTDDSANLLADHLINAPRGLATMPGTPERPEPLAFVVNGDGTAACFHSVRKENVQAWTPWETSGLFSDLVALDLNLFALVERSGALWLEAMSESFAALDGARIATSGTPTRSFSGFTHLAGRTVGVVSNGHDLGDAVVAGDGTITLAATQPAVTVIEAGLRFSQMIRTMPIDLDLPDGPARGLMKRLLRVLVQVDRSGQFKVQGKRVLLTFRGDDVATPPPLATGTFEARMIGVSRECEVDVEVQGAQRVTVLAITREVHVNG